MELPVSIENIKILLGATAKTVPVIPTASNRKRSITGILNSISQAEPSYLPAINALTVYPLMKWVLETRSGADVSLGSAEELLEKGPLPSRRNECFSYYEQLCSLVEENVEKLKDVPEYGKKYYRAVADVHFGRDEKAVSIYQLNTHYRPAVELVCGWCGERASELIEELNGAVSMDYSFSEEMSNPALEAAKRLIAFYPSSGKELRSLAEYGAASLENHPKDGPQLHRVMSAILEGVTSVDGLQQKIGLAWNTIARYRAEAINALGYLFWGYSCSELIYWLWEAQIEEQGRI